MRKLRPHYAQLLVLLLSPVLSSAQLDPGVDYISNLLRQEATLMSNQTMIEQVGQNNELNLIQTQLFSNSQNLAQVSQFGNFNSAYVRIKGNNTNTTLYQEGDQNQFDLEMLGNKTNLSFSQFGDHNKIKQEYAYLFESNISILQDGYNNLFEQVILVPTSIKMNITQLGSGISMKIINN